MKYGTFDENGIPIGFYAREVHGDSIPAEAVEITDAQWQEMIDNPGRRRNPETGEIEPVGPSLEERRKSACDQIDFAAGEARFRIVSPGELVDQEYTFAYQDALNFQAAGFTGDVPDTIQCWAEATGNTAQWAAEDIVATRAQFKAVSDQIRRIRLVAKEQIRTSDDIEQIRDVALAALAAIG